MISSPCSSNFVNHVMVHFGHFRNTFVFSRAYPPHAASQNVLENYPPYLLLLGLASVNRPTVAAAAGAVRLAGFVVYVISYRVSARVRVHQVFRV